MTRTHEVATEAPPKWRRAERRRRRGWTTSLLALASAVGVAIVPTLVATPAGAAGPTVITGHSGTSAPGLGVPVPEGTAQVNPTYVAHNPANGDTAIASTKAGSVYVYLIAGATEGNEYNIETAVGPPVVNGGLVAGDVYVVAGTGTAGLIAQPGNNQFNNSTTAVATSNPIEPTSVAFDPNGNLLIAGENTISGNSAVQVVAKTTGTFYGVAMTAGDLYTIGDVGLSGSPSTAINMGNQAAVANGMSVDASGNIAVGDGDGVIFVNEQSSGSLSLYGQSIAHHSATEVAGNSRGGTDCGSGAASAGASTLFFQSAQPTFDGSDNLYFADNEIGGSSGGGCAWVEPAQSGNLDGMSVTAGDVYKLAGNGGTTSTPDNTAGVQSNVSGTTEMTLDSAGNVVLGVQSGSGYGNVPAVQVLAESTGTFYGTSMTAGDIYTLASGVSGPTSVLNSGGGNLLFTDGANTSANLDELSGAPTAAIAPTVTGLSQSSGPVAGGTSVTITGTNLSNGTAAVHFGANAGTNVVVNSATSITANSPAGSAGPVNVTVTDTGGTSATSPADVFTYNPAGGGTVTVGKLTSLIGNYPDKVSGSAWIGETSVTLNECATTFYSAATCDAANQATVAVGTGKLAGIFKNDPITLKVGSIDTNGDTCGIPGASATCYIVVVGNTGVSTASTALSFKLPTFAVAKTTNVLGNYVDRLKASGFPIGDVIDVQECDGNVLAPSNVSTNCDNPTQITGTSGPSGVVIFTTGVTMKVNGAYVDGASGTCDVGGSCAIAVTDSNNAAIGLSTSVSFASPVMLLKKTTGVLGNYVDSVKAGGFPAGDPIVAQECNSSVVIPTTVGTDCDTVNEVTGTAGANGKVVFNAAGITMAVGGAYSDASSGACSAGGSCEIVVSDSANPSVGVDEAVSFAAPTGTVAVIANVQPNQLDKVTAGMFPVGDTVTAQECDSAVTPANVATNCDTGTAITGTAGPSGKVAFNVVGVTVKVGGAYTESGSGTVVPGGMADIVISDSTHSGFFIAVPIALAG